MRPLSTRSGFWLYFVLASLGVFLAPCLLSAATYIVPPDAEMIREADTIAIVTIQSSHSYWTADGRSIATDYEAVVESPLKAAPSAGSKIVITQKGGSVGHLALSVSSEPRYQAGERTLVMMQRLPMRRFTTQSGELGKFSFVRDTKSRQLAVRNATEGEIFGWDPAGQPHMERPRDADAFLRYIDAVVAGEDPVVDYELTNTEPFRPVSIITHAAGNDYMTQFTISAVKHGARWPGGAEPMKTVGTQTGVANLTGSIDTARGVWATTCTVGSSNLSITNTGTGTGTYGEPDGVNLIFFDQPNSGPLSGSTVGQATSWVSDDLNTNGSDTYYTMVDGDIVIEAGFTGSQFEAILAHEMGHTIGLRHSNEPQAGQTSFSTNALMNSTVPSTASLGSYDQEAVCASYGPPGNTGTSCTPVSITADPSSKTITAGQQTNLSVLVGGTTPYTYQWYIGTSNTDTSNPIAAPAGTQNPLNVTPTSTTTYWVRVTGCNSSVAISRPATVTVNQPTCTPPSISGQPQSQSITTGNSTSLSVSAGGTAPFSYQWYIGTSGNTSQPTGANSSSLNVSPTTTTSYWVRVTGQCAPAVDSNTATITVTADTCPEVNVQSPSAAKQTNGSYLLDVVATSAGGALNYQWFQGAVPGVGTQIGTGRPFSVPAPTAPISYWVRVFNNCNKSANSPTVVTIAPCDLPVIGTEPANQSIANGASATLTVAFTSATGATVRWYRGTAPDKTTEVGVGASINTGALTSTTQFWASITNTCGEKFTRTATITVGSACTAPTILTTSTAQTKLKGETVTLNVNASGTALHYQWYEGVPGDTSHPVGTDASSFTSAPLTKTTKFWVRVTNTCGNAPSGAIGVTVLLPRSRAVRH